jgi:hypothetical protein
MRPRLLPVLWLLVDVLGLTIVIPARLLFRAFGADRW